MKKKLFRERYYETNEIVKEEVKEIKKTEKKETKKGKKKND